MTKSKITLLICVLVAFFCTMAGFYVAGYISGVKIQKSDCARKISEINAAAANHIVSADRVARHAVMTTGTTDKIQWLKDNRAVK